jgi:tetratricopeptide (TPR) repeat protein
MKFCILLFFLASLAFAQDDPVLSKEVAKANKLLQENKVDDALEIYKEQLTNHPANSYLWYNIGNALFKKKQYAEARDSYVRSMSFTDTLSLANVNYNIGNTYLFESKLDTAITYYKRSLELNDKDEDAKYNLELARAILKEKAKKEKQKQSNQSQQKQEQQQPSEFAKKLFEQSKLLAKEYKFKEALGLLEQGLKQDPTINVYKQYIEKLKSVVSILGVRT